MLVLILSLIASGVLSYFDYSSSLGKHESRALIRGKDGRISAKLYAIWQAIFTGIFIMLPLLLGYPLWVAGVCQLPNVAWKVYAVIHNQKVARI